MATDKRLDQVSTLTDFDYALIVKGDQVAKASKQQLAELVGNLLYGATNASSLATVVAGVVGLYSKKISLERKNKAVKVVDVSSSSWNNQSAYIVGVCNGDVFKLAVGAINKSGNFYVTVSSDGKFNKGSYSLFKDNSGVYLVCISTSGVTDIFMIYSTCPINDPSEIDTSSMGSVTVE